MLCLSPRAQLRSLVSLLFNVLDTYIRSRYCNIINAVWCFITSVKKCNVDAKQHKTIDYKCNGGPKPKKVFIQLKYIEIETGQCLYTCGQRGACFKVLEVVLLTFPVVMLVFGRIPGWSESHCLRDSQLLSFQACILSQLYVCQN